MALTKWLRNSSAVRVLSDTAHASIDTLRQTTRSNPGSGIPPAMALASAALLGVVSTFSWSNVLNADKLKANVQQKQARQQGIEDSSDADTDTEHDHGSSSGFAAFARQEIESLVTGRS